MCIYIYVYVYTHEKYVHTYFTCVYTYKKKITKIISGGRRNINTYLNYQKDEFRQTGF